MKVSKSNAAQARRIFNLCMENGAVNGDRLKKAIAKITETKPRGYLELLTGLKRLIRLELESKQVTVTSAHELDAETSDKLKKDLTGKYGNDLVFDFQIDPSLLAGLKVRVGNDVWDGTVASRLKRLAETF